MMEPASIQVDQIVVERRLRALNEGQVEAIRASILDVGLLNPISVCARDVGGYRLVAGAHRLEATRRAGYDEISALILDLDENERTIAECDENLCRSELSPSERATFTRMRKEAYEARYPETQHGAIGNGREKSRQLGDSTSDRFTADTASKTGRSERAVQRDAERGEKVIPEVVEMIRGTALDTGTYLDGLKRLSPSEQMTAARRDLAWKKSQKRQTAKKAEKSGSVTNRYQPQRGSETGKSSVESILSMVEAIVVVPVDDLVNSAGRQRAVLGQRMFDLINFATEVREQLDR